MKEPIHRGKELLPLSVIHSAAAADAGAVERILRYYGCLLYTSSGSASGWK